MPKGTPKAKAVSINVFEQLQEKFTELQKRYVSLLQISSNETYLREDKTRLAQRSNILTDHNNGLCIALAICGDRINRLEENLVHVNTQLSEWQRIRNEAEVDEYAGESLGQTEPSNSPIQPTTKATIKSKPKTIKTKKTTRRKK